MSEYFQNGDTRSFRYTLLIETTTLIKITKKKNFSDNEAIYASRYCQKHWSHKLPISGGKQLGVISITVSQPKA